MAWFVLILSGVFEAVWAIALSLSDGFRKWRPSVVYVLASLISLAGLAWAMRTLPTGTAYAVWVGVGAALTVVYGFATKQERPTAARVALLVLLVGSVIGLKAVS